MFGVLCPNLAFFEPFLPKNTLPPPRGLFKEVELQTFWEKRWSLFAFLKVNNVH